MAAQNLLGWSLQEAFIRTYRTFDGRLNDTYVWIEEAIAEAKKTFDTPEIQLIPKTPSAKRCSRKKVERDPTVQGRSLRSTLGARNRESHDSGVEFEQPRKTRAKNLSRIEWDDSVSQLNSIRESFVLNAADETLELTDNRLLNTTAQNTTQNNRQKNTKRKNGKKQEAQEEDNTKVRDNESAFDDEAMLQIEHIKSHTAAAEEQSKLTGTKLTIVELHTAETDTEIEACRLSNKYCNESQASTDKVVSNLKVSGTLRESLPHRLSLNDKKLSAEFGIKNCLIVLDAGSVTVETAARPSAVNPNPISSGKENYFPSPHSNTPQVNNIMSPTGSSSSSVSAGGRLLNMVKSAVGALLPAVMRRTGSPSVTTGADSPLATRGCDSADSSTPTNNAPESFIKVGSAKQPSGRVSKSRRSSSIKVYTGGPKLSMSKRRSSAFGYKARLADARKSRSLSVTAVNSNSSAVAELEQAPIVSNALADEKMVVDDGSSESDEDDDDDDDEQIMDTPPQRVTRSKVRQCPRTVVTVPKKIQAEPTAPALRVTRSKLRVKDKPQSLEDDDDDDTPTAASGGFQAPKTPSTVVKAKPIGHKVQQLQNLLCQNPSFGLGNSVLKVVPVSSATSNSSARRKSSKRAREDQQIKSDSPPKRLCMNLAKQSFLSPTENGRRVQQYGSCQPNKTVEVHSFLKKKPTTPVQNTVSSVITSFLQKNTPKILTREEIFERKRRELEEKNKKMNEMAQKRTELLQKRVEAQRRVREEQYQLVQKRRQDLERDAKKTTSTVTTNTRLSEDNAPRMATRLQLDDRPKVDQQEKQKLRDKRIVEAEQRRKQEEETKKQMLLQQEREKQAQDEQARRRREQEEAERQQRMAEQRRQEQERRARLERERQLEIQRQRQVEEQRLREEQEKQRVKEERERKERAEKERQEIERMREKERQKLLEIERQKEMERIRIAEERMRQEEERRMREEQQKTQKAIEKHNSLQKQVSSTNVSHNATSGLVKKDLVVSLVNVSNTTVMKQMPAVDKSQTESTLNRTFNKETNCESYEMTPVAKKVYKSSTFENYDIGDLNSEDSTDEEDKPRKRIPGWAEGTALKVALINQHCHPPNLAELFGTIAMPDLNELFVKKRPRFNKRTSSAVWESSILLPKSP